MPWWVRLAIIALVSIPALAQSTEKVSLDLGSVTVWLGMPRQEVVNKCTAAGYKQYPPDDHQILFLDSGNHEYTTQFKSGLLVYADREWYTAKGDMDAFQTTMAAMGSLVDKQKFPLSCMISHEPISKPGTHVNRLFVLCGKRSFLLIDGQFEITKGRIYGVTERIGDMLLMK